MVLSETMSTMASLTQFSGWFTYCVQSFLFAGHSTKKMKQQQKHNHQRKDRVDADVEPNDDTDDALSFSIANHKSGKLAPNIMLLHMSALLQFQ